MSFKEIGHVLGLKDLEESSIPKLDDVSREKDSPTLVWKLLTDKNNDTSREKNSSI